MTYGAVVAMNVAASLAAVVLVLHKNVDDNLLERLALSFIGTLAGINSYTLIVYEKPVVSLSFLGVSLLALILYAVFQHRAEIRWRIKLH